MRACLLLVLSICLMAMGATPDFQTPFKVEANSSPIYLSDDHANPLITDWNGDGLKDLIVGQFTYGRLRYYQNIGTNSSPVFGSYSYMQADGSTISVSYG